MLNMEATTISGMRAGVLILFGLIICRSFVADAVDVSTYSTSGPRMSLGFGGRKVKAFNGPSDEVWRSSRTASTEALEVDSTVLSSSENREITTFSTAVVGDNPTDDLLPFPQRKNEIFRTPPSSDDGNSLRNPGPNTNQVDNPITLWKGDNEEVFESVPPSPENSATGYPKEFDTGYSGSFRGETPVQPTPSSPPCGDCPSLSFFPFNPLPSIQSALWSLLTTLTP